MTQKIHGSVETLHKYLSKGYSIYGKTDRDKIEKDIR